LSLIFRMLKKGNYSMIQPPRYIDFNPSYFLSGGITQ
jgi:hypothetical protein